MKNWVTYTTVLTNSTQNQTSQTHGTLRFCHTIHLRLKILHSFFSEKITYLPRCLKPSTNSCNGNFIARLVATLYVPYTTTTLNNKQKEDATFSPDIIYCFVRSSCRQSTWSLLTERAIRTPTATLHTFTRHWIMEQYQFISKHCATCVTDLLTWPQEIDVFIFDLPSSWKGQSRKDRQQEIWWCGFWLSFYTAKLADKAHGCFHL